MGAGFRVRENAAPLKPGTISPNGTEYPRFRVRENAAPLKQVDPHYIIVDEARFRVRENAAPLKHQGFSRDAASRRMFPRS